MINQAMKEKLTKNNHDLANFKSELNHDIGKSLNIMSKSRQINSDPSDRNFLGEFKNLLHKRKANPDKNIDSEIKNTYSRYIYNYFNFIKT